MQTTEDLDSLLSNDIIEQNYSVDLINSRIKMVFQLIEVTAGNCGLVKAFRAQESKRKLKSFLGPILRINHGLIIHVTI